MMNIPGGIFYNTGIQQKSPSSHLYWNEIGGPFGIPIPHIPPPYCQNCECPGCIIHRERLRLQQERYAEEEAQRKKILEQAIFHSPGLGCDVDAATGDRLKPGSVVRVDAKPGMVTEEWWKKHRWKFYAFWLLGIAAAVHLFMTCATRTV